MPPNEYVLYCKCIFLKFTQHCLTILTFLSCKIVLKRSIDFFLICAPLIIKQQHLSMLYKDDILCLLLFEPHCSLFSSVFHYVHHHHPHLHCCYCCSALSCWMQTFWRLACPQDCVEEMVSLWGLSQPHLLVGKPLLLDYLCLHMILKPEKKTAMYIKTVY